MPDYRVVKLWKHNIWRIEESYKTWLRRRIAWRPVKHLVPDMTGEDYFYEPLEFSSYEDANAKRLDLQRIAREQATRKANMWMQEVGGVWWMLSRG